MEVYLLSLLERKGKRKVRTRGEKREYIYENNNRDEYNTLGYQLWCCLMILGIVETIGGLTIRGKSLSELFEMHASDANTNIPRFALTAHRLRMELVVDYGEK